VKYYLISGEASGDLHGSQLIRALKAIDPDAHFRAWGGDLIKQEGVILVKHYKELSIMGFWELIPNIPKILKNIKYCKEDILKYMPDAIIYIDYPGFNLRISKWAQIQGFKNHYYISPKVWAWKENRVRQMKRSLDALYVILPFEKDFYEKNHQFPVNFVGHPLLDQLSYYQKNTAFFESYNLNPKKPVIALLPGSRIQEIQKILPVFIKVADHFKMYQFVIAGAPGVTFEKYIPFIKKSNLKVIKDHTYDLLQNSTAALVASGTATLETALFEIPQIVCYISNSLNYWIGKKLIKLKYISLVNLILNKEALTELIQDDCNVKNLIYHLKELLKKDELEKINKDYQDLKLKLGGPGASKKTAKLIFDSLK